MHSYRHKTFKLTSKDRSNLIIFWIGLPNRFRGRWTFKFQEEGKETPQKKIKTRAKTKSGKKLLAPMVQGPKELAKEPSFQICDQHMITPLLEIPPCLLMKFRGNLLRKTEQNCLSNHSSWGRLWVVCVGVWNKKLERKREQLSVRNILDTTLTKPQSFNQNLCSCDPYLW